jgi:CubicO group peptidase (beta-lactamase class C family)
MRSVPSGGCLALRPLRQRPHALLLAAALLLGNGCGSSPRTTASATSASGEDAAKREEEVRRRKDRHLDERISVDNVERRLSPYLDSIGAGFGPGAQPSGVVSLSAGGDVIYERGLGYADVARETRNDEDTAFRIGAITAQFTAAAVLRLVQAGKLATSNPISKFLPDYPGPGRAISVHQLLSHTSGLPNYSSHPELLARRAEAFTPHELLELFWAEPLEFEPGLDFGYSDSDYVVLGLIIEQVTRQSYAQHMQEALFEPFDLEDTHVGALATPKDAARGYSAAPDGGLVPAAGFDDSILYAAAGVRSTAHDLQKWHDALQEGEVLEPELEEQSLRVVKNHYAYGWFVREQRGHGVSSHPGAVEGFVSHFARVPELDLSIVVLMNNSSVDATSIADAALGIALGEPIEPLPKQTSVALDPSVPPRITGTYRLSEASAKQLAARKIPKAALFAMRAVRIYQTGDGLFFKPQGQAAVPMVATGRGSFVLVGGKAKIEVPLDPGDAPATRLVLDQGPLHAEFERRARQRGKQEEPEEQEEDQDEDQDEPSAEP